MKGAHNLLLLFAICIQFRRISSSKNIKFSYDAYCGSLVPEASVLGPYNGSFSLSFPYEAIFNPHSQWDQLYLSTQTVNSTSSSNVFKVEAQLLMYGEQSKHKHSISLAGFWSASTGNLCMVGSQNDAGLRLTGVETWRNITSLITGRLETSNGESLALGFLPTGEYRYTEIEKILTSPLPSDIDVPFNLSLRSDFDLFRVSLHLVYKPGCSFKKCYPFDDRMGALPKVLTVIATGYDANDRYRSPIVMEFSDDPDSLDRPSFPSFLPRNLLIGEAAWDPKREKVFIAACSVTSPSTESDSFSVNDCSIRMCLYYPRLVTAANPNSVRGYMWSTKDTKDSAFFERIMLRRELILSPTIWVDQYEYTLMDKAMRICPTLEIKYNGKPKFPNPWYLFELTAYEREINSDSPATFVTLTPFQPSSTFIRWQELNTVNYQVYVFIDSVILITAEGTYDTSTGQLCMVGCRNVENSETPDCEIFIHVKYPPLDSRHVINGVIKSTRQKNDTLYFGTITFSKLPYNSNFVHNQI